jgi:hypothetical protein
LTAYFDQVRVSVLQPNRQRFDEAIMLTPSPSKSGIWLAQLLLVLAVSAGAAFADPPARVARLAVLRGDVSFSSAGEDNWHAADFNRPLVSGDRLYTDRDARAELDVGGASVRLDERSGFSILGLDDRVTQLELTQGTLNLHVHKLYSDQTYEVDTPTLAFVVSQPGEYRIDTGEQGNTTSVTVFNGAGDVFGEDDARYRVDRRQTYRFSDSRLRDVDVLDLPRSDDFDNWCFARDEQYDNSLSHRYVSDEMVGAADLDNYGAWDDMPEYGTIWFPAHVGYGWAPYRDGHWAWIDPWGWTWVDNAPWGFAPFHYGRWVYVGNRWGWLPGPAELRPVYAPALVVFIGGDNWHDDHRRGGEPVGWCPLGPRDIYDPPYHVSHGYFTHVNASNSPAIDHDRIDRDYEHYAHGREDHDHHYTYRHDPAAVTAVSRETFVHARPVADGRLHVNNEELAHAGIDHGIVPSPTTASLIPATDNARAAVPRELFQRSVIAHRAPPPPAAPFAARLRAVERNGGRPLADDELQQINARHSAEPRYTTQQRVQVVGPARAIVPAPAPAPRERSVPENAVQVSPAPDNKAPQPQEAPSAGRRPHEEQTMPSAHFAPPRGRERDTGQGAAERTSKPQETGPVTTLKANQSPASQPENVRTDEPHVPSAGSFPRERNSEAPGQRHNDAVPPVEDNRNRSLQRHIPTAPREAAPVPANMPPARSGESAPRTERPSRETAAPPPQQQQQAPHNQPSSPRQDAHEAEHGQAEHGKDAGYDTGNVSQQPGTTGR